MMWHAVTFKVLGVAQPKGSTRAFVVKGRAVVTSTNRNLKGWQQQIATAAQTAAHGYFFDGPVSIDITFALPRPKSLPKRVTLHAKRPDLDKLIRSVCDALTGILWRDDACVVEVHARKTYAPEAMPPSLAVAVATADVPFTEPGRLALE